MSALSASPQAPAASRAGALDALRFLAAAFIVLYHFGPNAPVELSRAATIFERGWLATDFFLILSGYILGRAYGSALDDRRLRISRFFLRRATRVWPAQLIVLAGLAILVIAAAVLGGSPGSPERFQGADFLAQATLTHAWGLTLQAGWNEPSWTLSALIVCYAAFPLIWLVSRPLRGKATALVAALALLIGAAALSLTLLHHSLFDLPFHQGVLRALPLFAVGALLSRFAGSRALSRAASVASGLSALGALIVLQAPEPTEATAFASILAIAVIVVAADGLRAPSPRWLKATADLSFALFITHALVGAGWFGLVERVGLGSSWLAWGVGCLVALGVAILFDRLVDRPIQRRMRGLLERPAPAPAAARSEFA